MSDTFCILPFLHINAYPDKKLKVCCYSQTFLENTNLENDSISDAFNSDEYKQIRLDMLNGEKPKFCDVCYKMDEEGAESYRTKWNNYYSHLIQKYKNKMIDNVAKLCEVNKSQINIKGKTTEKLGVVGKENAIACEVITSVIKYDQNF